MQNYGKDYFKEYKEQKFKWQFWAWYLKRKIKREDTILEIGCTYGFLYKYLKDYKKTIGIDISKFAIKQAQSIAPHAEFYVMNGEKLEFTNKSFQTVVCLDTIEHMKNPEASIKEISRVMTNNGLLIITTPNPESLSAKRKGKDWFAYQDKTHISIHSTDYWQNLLKQHNFRIEETKTMDCFDYPFANKLFTAINYALYQIKYPFFPKGDNTFIVARKVT